MGKRVCSRGLGPLLFSLGLHETIKPIATDPEYQGTWQTWFLDDGTLIGPLTLLEKILAKLTPSLDAVHLQVNLSKTVVFTTGSVETFPFLSKITRISASD